MSPDEYQQAWRAESDQTRVTVDSDLLLQKVRRNQESFRAMILLRDYREAGIAILMIPLWLYLGIRFSEPWTWYLTVPALIWVSGFIVVDRLRHPQKRKWQDDSLLSSAKESLTQVEHQIWLLRNVMWWYLLPLLIPLLAFCGHVVWQVSRSWGEAMGAALPVFAIVLAVYTLIYFLNQYAVRKQLEPRREELVMLLAGLCEESTGEVSGAFPILMGERCVTCSPRRMLVGNLCALVLLLTGVGIFLYLAVHEDGYPKASPFAAVRWEESQPEVQIGDAWFKLISMDDVPTSEIVAFCQRTYGDKWQKRFEEDLVEVLMIMGHAPGDEVTLVVESLTSGESETLRDVPMTRANRQAIREAAQARQRAEQAPDEVRAPSNREDGPEGGEPLAQAIEGIRASNKLPALAAFSLRDGAIVERATVGTCTMNGRTPVLDDAQWHLGSNTKAMTATVAGMLVEEGLLEWDSTVGEVLGNAAPDMDGGHRDTTLAMLLHHTSGIAANINWFSAPEDRVACVAQILRTPPEGQRGVYAYSNAGYVVAGAMMEVVAGKRWEVLMQEKLFGPLGMKDTGFGAPRKPGSPWGHERGFLGWTPKDPAERNADNAPVLGPAGTVHTTLEDYARFVAAHLKGAQGQDGIVSAETFKTLHAPLPGWDYGMGWIITERDWAGGRALTHGGSNTLWFATVWIAPEKDMAFFAVTNAGGDTAFEAVDKAIGAMIGRHLPG